MGRRSINTTKSGKYMNPTDQARKEARKKELKKNKRQRQMVRAAVLKNKDPAQILEEMEKIDEMEYNVMQASPLNEKVLRDKRKKLKETFDRVMRLYHGEEPELWADLKRREVDYEKKRMKKQQYFESVKHAQSVQIDEIPLPQMNAVSGATFSTGPNSRINVTQNVSITPFSITGLAGIQKKAVEMPLKVKSSVKDAKKNETPGCPPGPPPDLLEMSDLDSDAENEEVILKEYPKKSKTTIRLTDDENQPTVDADGVEIVKPNALQQRMLAISGQNIDEFMKEMENVHKKKEKERQAEENGSSSDENSDSENSSSSKSDNENDDEDDDEDDDDDEEEDQINNPKETAPATSIMPTTNQLPSLVPPSAHPLLPSGLPPPPSGMPPPMMFRPPPMRPGIPQYGIRMPPPPGRLGMPMALAPRMGLRMPPGPPPGMPPRMMHHHKNLHLKDTKGITTITAKPQIRNLSADVTRFLPSALRVKREDSQKPRKRPFLHHDAKPAPISKRGVTKDDAYMVFMKEMQGLL